MGGIAIARKMHEKRSVSVTICLTERQKTAIETLAKDWDIDMATIGRRLIHFILNKKAALPELLEKYQVVYTSEISAREHTQTTPAVGRRKIYRISIRLTQEKKRELNILAGEGFRLPGELGGILFELFIAGVIKKDDIQTYSKNFPQINICKGNVSRVRSRSLV